MKPVGFGARRRNLLLLPETKRTRAITQPVRQSKALLLRVGRGRYNLYHPLFRLFLQEG